MIETVNNKRQQAKQAISRGRASELSWIGTTKKRPRRRRVDVSWKTEGPKSSGKKMKESPHQCFFFFCEDRKKEKAKEARKKTTIPNTNKSRKSTNSAERHRKHQINIELLNPK